MRLPAQKHQTISTMRPLSRAKLDATGCWRISEQRLVQAYLKLFLVAPGADGVKIVPLARFGAYEVRLVEFAPELADEVSPLWLDLYAHDQACSLDSRGCDALEDAVKAADALIERAQELHWCWASRCSWSTGPSKRRNRPLPTLH